MMLLIFSLFFKAYALPEVSVVQIKPSQLSLLKKHYPNLETLAFTKNKSFEEFNNIYTIYNAPKNISTYIEKVFKTHTLTPLNIKPTPKHSLSPIGQSLNDSYYNYQWHLESRQHILHKQKYGLGKYIESQSINEQASIQWSDVKTEFEQSFKRKSIIAVLDSGVDIRHPDLATHIYKNKPECRYVESLDLYLPETTFTEDIDNNGYAGDCAGWNFAVLSRPKKDQTQAGNNQVYDDTGHGTHISGIIAAVENSIGIVGMSQNIEILPIKVLKQIQSERESRIISYEGLSHWVAQGILYAIEKNVDVINLSLGWPERVQNELVNLAIERAHNAGIILIAGSGNDSHNASIYPCAHPYVICVGSSGIDGQMSEFSNYGPHVDLLAPGEYILSLLPQKVDSLDFNKIILFSDDLLAYMSGSSQSAPIISAVAAMLKTQNKNFNEIKNLLISSSGPSLKTISGKFSLKKLICLIKNENCLTQKQNIVLSTSKDKAQLKDNKLFLNFKNLGNNSEILNLAVYDENNNLIQKINKTLKANEDKLISIDLNFKHKVSEADFKIHYNDFKINITAKYENEAEAEDYKILNFKNTPSNILSEWKNEAYDKRNSSYLYSAKSMETGFATDYYFTKSIDYENKEITISLFKIQKNEVIFVNSITLNNTTNLLSVSSLDLDFNGSQDFFVRTQSYDDKLDRPFEIIFYLNQDLTQIAPPFSIYAEQAIATMPSDFKFLKFNNLKYPFIFKNGLVSKKSVSALNYDDLISDSLMKTQRIYSFLPSNADPQRLEEHSFTNTQWFRELSENLYSTVFPNQKKPMYYQAELLLLLDSTDLNNISFITRLYNQKKAPHLEQYLFKTTVNILDHKTHSEALDIDALILGNKFLPFINLNSNKTKDFTLSAVFNDKREHLRLLHKIDDKWITQDLYAKGFDNRFISYHASYKNDEFIFLYFETASDLVIQKYNLNDLKNPLDVFKRTKVKSDFLPPFTLEELYLPIIVDINGQKVPALYNDQTQLFSGRIQILKPTEGKLAADTNMSYQVSEECQNLALQFKNGIYKAVVFCPKQAHIKIKDLTTSFFE